MWGLNKSHRCGRQNHHSSSDEGKQIIIYKYMYVHVCAFCIKKCNKLSFKQCNVYNEGAILWSQLSLFQTLKTNFFQPPFSEFSGLICLYVQTVSLFCTSGSPESD